MDIIIISIAAFILLMFLVFRQSIIVFVLRTVYGEYSHQYIQKFKQLTNRKPHPYCFKDDFYYHILALRKAQHCPAVYQSKDPFSFEGNDFETDFEMEFDDILLKKGKPDCFTFSDEKEIALKVVGYKSMMFHSKEKTLFYFCGKRHFITEYVFSGLASDTANLIIKTLSDDLGIDIKYAKNFTIVDPSGNYLYFTDTGFFLSLKFFNINNKAVQNILGHTDMKMKGLETISLLKCD